MCPNNIFYPDSTSRTKPYRYKLPTNSLLKKNIPVPVPIPIPVPVPVSVPVLIPSLGLGHVPDSASFPARSRSPAREPSQVDGGRHRPLRPAKDRPTAKEGPLIKLTEYPFRTVEAISERQRVLSGRQSSRTGNEPSQVVRAPTQP